MSCHHDQLVPLSLVLELISLQHSHQVAQHLVSPLKVVGVQTVGQHESLRRANVCSNPPHQLVSVCFSSKGMTWTCMEYKYDTVSMY